MGIKYDKTKGMYACLKDLLSRQVKIHTTPIPPRWTEFYWPNHHGLSRIPHVVVYTPRPGTVLLQIPR